MKEEWTRVTNHAMYLISNHGRVKSLIKNRMLSGTIDSDGYLVFTFYTNGSCKKMQAQRLVALHFIENTLSKPTVNHKDGNKLNNHFSNLEWATWSEQNHHAIATGLRTIRRGFKRTEAQKAKQSKAMKGHIPWNKGKRGLQVAWNKGLKKNKS